MKFYQEQLTNGLTIIGEQRDSAVSSALGFFVRTGARDETPEVSGVSHFLEHMMFKGTPTRTALDINYQLGALGAQANAFTSEENTVYYAAVLPEYFEQAHELFSDMLRPALDEGEFNVEKKVILEEIALYQDRPTHIIFEAALKHYFSGHTAGNSVLGSQESVGALTRSQMKAYFDSRYSPTNIVLCVSGRFDWKAVVDWTKRHCGHWLASPVTRELRPHPGRKNQTNLQKENMARAHVCLVGSGPSVQEKEKYAAQVLTCILGDSSGSKVYWELVDKGLVDSASIDGEEMDGVGIVVGYASASTEKLPQVCEILRRILAQAKDFSDQELERAKTKLGTRIVLQGESSMRRLMSVGLDWVYSQEYVSVAEELKKVQEVDRQCIGELLEKYPFEPMTEVRLLPKTE